MTVGKLRVLSRYRPRVLTVLVFLVVATLLVLSNLSSEWAYADGLLYTSRGWPFVWHRDVHLSTGYTFVKGGWYYSATRLAASSVLCLATLTCSAGACEWLLRRYRPRLRWNLKTMLAAVALVAAGCGWFVPARDRAALQDPVLAEPRLVSFPGALRVERSGPAWLDAVGADRYRRRIVSADLTRLPALRGDNADDERLLAQLARLPDLRCLSFAVDHLSPAMAAALNEMRQLQRLVVLRKPVMYYPPSQSLLPPIGKMARLRDLELDGLTIDDKSLAGLADLRSLDIDGWFAELHTDIWQEMLTAIGHCTQLEHLRLLGMSTDGESLTWLAALANLKTLSLNVTSQEGPQLSRLPSFGRLEALELWGDVGDDDLGCLARLPRLTSLTLGETDVSAAGLARLTWLESLEELTLEDGFVDGKEERFPLALEKLVALKRLAKLHLGANAYSFFCDDPTAEPAPDEVYDADQPETNVEAFRRALGALRRSHPGIVIDGVREAVAARGCAAQISPFDPEGSPNGPPSWLPPSNPATTAAMMASFEANGGWVRFDSVGFPYHDGDKILVRTILFK